MSWDVSKWDKRFIALAELISTWSKDPSTKVGCVIINPTSRAIVSTGYNGFPRDIMDEVITRWERPAKYGFIEHAERNAIYNAAWLGHQTAGCQAFINWDPDSICTDCARALLQAGIVRIVGPKGKSIPVKNQGGWHDHRHYAIEMLAEAGVEVVSV